MRISRRNHPTAGILAGLLVASFLLPTHGGRAADGPGTPGEPVPTGVRLSQETPVTATDIRESPANNSPMLAADPTDARFVVQANRLDAPDFGCSLSVSGDRGKSWERARPVPRLPGGAEKCYAPEIVFDRKGRLHYLFVGLRGSGNEPMGVFLTTSSNRARSFTRPRRILGPERYMVRMAMDRSRGEQGRIHLVWLQAGADPPLGGLPDASNPIMSSFSDDGGRTFSRPVRASDPSRRLVVAPALALSPDGTLHIAFYDLQEDLRDYMGLEGPAWEGQWSLALATSRDGGRTFSHSEIDREIVPHERVLLIFTMPPPALSAGRSGRLYAAWPDARHGDPDILFRSSADSGKTWRPIGRINDDDVGSGGSQYLPRLAVSPNGRVDAIFLDRRNDPENLRNDAYFATSSNRGRSFSKNMRLTTESSDSRVGQVYLVPSAQGRFEFGGRLGLLSTDSYAVAAWTDTRNSLVRETDQDVFARTVFFGKR